MTDDAKTPDATPATPAPKVPAVTQAAPPPAKATPSSDASLLMIETHAEAFGHVHDVDPETGRIQRRPKGSLFAMAKAFYGWPQGLLMSTDDYKAKAEAVWGHPHGGVHSPEPAHYDGSTKAFPAAEKPPTFATLSADEEKARTEKAIALYQHAHDHATEHAKASIARALKNAKTPRARATLAGAHKPLAAHFRASAKAVLAVLRPS